MENKKTLMQILNDIMSWVKANLFKLEENLSKEIVAKSETWEVKDSNDNTIFKVDEDGVHTTALRIRDVDNEFRHIMGPTETENRITEKVDEFREELQSPRNSWTIQDQNGNIVARFNEEGLQVTKINTKEFYLNGVQVDEKGIALPDAEDYEF